MKTETEVTLTIIDMQAQEFLHNEPEGFIIKVFLACSQNTTKVFRLTG